MGDTDTSRYFGNFHLYAGLHPLYGEEGSKVCPEHGQHEDCKMKKKLATK